MKSFNKKIVLSFDLDYTLIDNTKGIIDSFNYSLKKHGIRKVNEADILRLIGTPLDDMFKQYSDKNPEILAASFREYYGEKGIYSAKLYKGTREKLEELKSLSFKLGVVTSKKQTMAIKLLKILEIFSFFEYIIGESENMQSKEDSRLHKKLKSKYPDYKFVVIGDHLSDRQLAEAIGASFIGLTSGYHTAEELHNKSKVKCEILNSIIEITPELIRSIL